MAEPLDEDLLPEDKNEHGLTSLPVRKASFYLLVMLLGQLAIEYWLTRQIGVYSIPYVLTGVLYPLLISTGLEAFRWWRHRRKEQRRAELIPRDPFWFQVLEGGMAIWMLFLAAILIRRFLL